MTRSLQVVLSVFVWWVLVVLPSVLTLSGAFGDLDVDTEVGGSVVAVWIVCFCAQLGMLYVVGHAVGHTRIWWFLVGSLLPWAVSWSAPVGWGWALLWIAIAGLFALAMIVFALRSLALDEHGIVVTATVKKVLRNYFNIVINNVYVYRRLLLEVPGTNGGPSSERPLWMLCEIGTSPAPGDRLKLRVDPRHPRHLAVDPSHFAKV